MLAIILAGLAFAIYDIKSHPLVFNESLWEHGHCMPQAASALLIYAKEHQGRFPCHTNGYGDALLMAAEEGPWYYLTGPGYDDTRVFAEAAAHGGDVDERQCGRVYIQGLSETNDVRIAILFDKVAAPPDHCHFRQRLWVGYVREVCFVNGSWRTVPVEQWKEFARQQVHLLLEAGFTRQQAEQLYAEAK